jgi:hypothetical protein
MAVIRELVTKLGFKVDTKAIDDFDKKVFKLNKNVKRLAIAFTGAVTAGIAMAKSAANVGDEIAKTARAYGVSTDFLQKYRFAAELAGVEQSKFNSTLNIANRMLGQAAMGGNDAAKAYEELGVSIRDSNGDVRSLDDVFLEALAAIERIPTASERAALAMRIFGRDGGQVANLLSSDLEELENQANRFENLGLVIDEETLQRSEDFNDQLTEFWAILRGLRVIIGAALLPQMQELVSRFSEFITENKELIQQNAISFFQSLFVVVKFLVDAISSLITVMSFIYKSFKSALSIISSFISFISFVGSSALSAFSSVLSTVASGLNIVADAAKTAYEIVMSLFRLLDRASGGVIGTVISTVSRFAGNDSVDTLSSTAPIVNGAQSIDSLLGRSFPSNNTQSVNQNATINIDINSSGNTSDAELARMVGQSVRQELPLVYREALNNNVSQF